MLKVRVKLLQELPLAPGADNPDLFKYPVPYMVEPGFWTLDDREALVMTDAP